MNDKIISSRRYWAVIAAVVVGVAVLVFYRPQVKHYMSDQGVVWTTDYHVTYEASSIPARWCRASTRTRPTGSTAA